MLKSAPKGAVELVRMAVRADLRGQGISSLLLLAVARFALSIDCDWVVLTTGMVKKTDLRLRASTILASSGHGGEFTQPRAHLFDPFYSRKSNGGRAEGLSQTGL